MQLSRPAVRVNQVGYVHGGPMRATWVSEAVHPESFELLDETGRPRAGGWSEPWPLRPDPTSGLSTHLLDFTGTTHVGRRWRIRIGSDLSLPFTIGRPPYGSLAEDALGFFALMRSGCAVDDDDFPGYGRPAGHLGAPPNRGDTAVAIWTGRDAEQWYPGWRQPGAFDVSGGWYDAGDYGKYVTSGAIAVWQLLGVLDILPPMQRGLRTRLTAECRWQLDWLLRMQIAAGQPNAGLVFHRVHGTGWSPMPGLPHTDPTERVLHRPSTVATLQFAAVAASAARRLRLVDPDYAARLVAAARTAFVAARRHGDLMPPDDHARFGGGPYGDDDPSDDLFWAATELWMTTRDPVFGEAVQLPAVDDPRVFPVDGFDQDSVTTPALLDLAVTERDDAVFDLLRNGAGRLLDRQAAQPWGQPYAPEGGWAWGSNGRLLNNLVVLGHTHRLFGERRYLDAMVEGLDYLFGRNALGQSYVVGYGIDSSRHLRTRQFGHDLDPQLPPPPPGAVAGGPNSVPSNDFPYDDRLLGRAPQCCYLDEPTSEVTNDVCIRWNAPLVWVTAYLSSRTAFLAR